MNGCNILFDNILLRAKVDCHHALQTEKVLQTELTKKINQVFREFGWDVYFWGRRGSSLYWYLNGKANSIMRYSQKKAEEILTNREYTGVQEKIQNTDVKVGDYPFGVPYETLESTLNGSNVLFRNAIKSVINESRGIGLRDFTPWIWFKGISIYIITSPRFVDVIRKEVYIRFENELHYIDEYDKKINLNMKKRMIISKSKDLSITEVKLRFPRGEDYLLTVIKPSYVLSRYYEPYKGITKIFSKMLRFVWIGEYQQAFSYLSEEGKKAIFDENKKRKISKLSSSLEKFVEYKQLKKQSTTNLYSRSPERMEKLEYELKRDGFFSMYIIALRDLRVFEFEVSGLIGVINRVCKQ